MKDENKWAKDAENQKIDVSIMELHNKQLIAVNREFGKKGDDWALGKDGEKYMDMVGKTVWDSSNRHKNKNIVRKNIAEATDIKEAIQKL